MAKLAQSITITLGGKDIHLVPRLRFAMRLERRPGSFAALVREIMDGSLSAAVEIIGDHVPVSADTVFDALPDLREPLLTYVMALAGIDPEDTPANDNAKGKTVPFTEHLAGLYRIGTGWLGWTPADTLDATPAEITEAHAGRLDMLKAIFGVSDEKPDRSTLPLDEKIKTAFAGFNTVRVSRKKAG